MPTFLHDVRYALRMLLKSPGFTAVAVLTLAAGIAANTAVFSWIDSVLLRPLAGVPDAAQLMSFETATPNGEFITTCYPDYRDYRDHLTLVSGLAVARPTVFSLGEEDHAEQVWGELVSGNYFAVLGVKPILGRAFSPDEYGDKQGGYPVAVIGERLWEQRFHRDAAILGRTVRINRQQLTIVGVAPADFRGSLSGLVFELWAPVVMAAQLNAMPEWMLRDRQSRVLLAVARLKPGVTAERAQAEVSAVAQQFANENPATNKGMGAAILPISKAHFGAQSTLGPLLRILMAVCGVVLLIVCANVANLLLARATSRQKEFCLRLALGAARVRIVRQLLVENLILAAMAGLAGAPLALWMSRSLGAFVPDSGLPVSLDIQMSVRVLVFTILLCGAASLLSGMAPALHTTRVDLDDTLKQSGRGGSAGPAGQRLRSVLVVSEVALALVAIIGAGLFARSFQFAREIHPGFDPQGILVAQLHLASAGYKVPERINFCIRLRQALEAEAGIRAAGYADYIPLGFAEGAWEDLRIEGYVPDASENMKVYRTVVAPGYFDLMRIPLVDGRDFDERDDRQTQPVMVVNQKFVKRFFGARNPIGRKVHGWGRWFTIVGVVRDTKYHTPQEDQRALFYVPFRQVYREDLGIAIYARTDGDPKLAAGAVRRAVQRLDPGVGVFMLSPLGEYMAASLFAQKVAASLLGVLSAIAVVLAAIGLYSVIAYSITQRIQEIGIRMALGAGFWDVLALVGRQAAAIVLCGMAVGAGAAAALTRAASGLLVNVSPTDPKVFGGAAAFLAGVALLAVTVPATHAAHIDPNRALRSQ